MSTKRKNNKTIGVLNCYNVTKPATEFLCRESGRREFTMNIAIITGASSGMGMEYVRQLDHYFRNIDEIWVIARREDRLQQLQSLTRIKVRPFTLDLSEGKGLKKLKKTLKQEQPVIRILINSAGYGKIGTFEDISYSDNLGMIDINCKALTAVTYMALPYMRRNSRIIQMASMASYLPQAGFSVYAATKAYVLSFCTSLNEELRKRSIFVTAVCPGPVDTEFFDIAEQTGKEPVFKKMFMANPKKVVAKALLDSLHKRERSIYGTHYQIGTLVLRFLPVSLAVRLVNCLK